MRLEDVKPGMWVRTSNGDVGNVAGFDGPCVRVRFDGSDLLGWWGASCLEPWVPRVGEWVRNLSDTIAPVVGIRHATENCEAVATLGHPSGCTWCVKDLEPCAPPEAALAESFKAATLARSPEAQATQERIAAMVEAEMAERLRQREEILRGNAKAAIARDHNATCSRCGGRAYQGIGLAKCVEPACDDPETREPDDVRRVVDTRRRWGFDANGHEDHRCYVERVYEATGRDVAVRHPTREGAIAAWRKAVCRRVLPAPRLSRMRCQWVSGWDR